MPSIISNSIQAHIARFNKSKERYEHLLIERAETETIYPLMWQAVTGWIEEGESALDAAFREVKEETNLSGIKIYQIPHIASFFIPKQDTISLSAIIGIVVDSDSKVELSGEHRDFIWLEKKDALKKLLLPSHKKGLKLFDKILSKDLSVFEINPLNIK